MSKGVPMGPQYGPLVSLNGYELWPHIVKVGYDGVVMVLYGFRIRGP